MFNWYVTDLVEAQRRNEKLARAERHRLAEHVLSNKRQTLGRSRHFLARMGAVLVVWGCRLQSRYGNQLVSSVGVSAPGANARTC